MVNLEGGTEPQNELLLKLAFYALHFTLLQFFYVDSFRN